MDRFTWVPVASDLHDAAAVDGMVEAHTTLLAAIGGVRGTGPGSGRPTVLLVVTGGTERRLLDCAAEIPGPVVMVAHPGHNSLAASMEALAKLHQDGEPGQIVYAPADDPEAAERIIGAVADLEVWAALRAIRIGAVGEPSDWLVASSPDPATVRAVWGPEVVPVEITELTDRYRPTADDTVARAQGITAALREVVDTHRLDALTVRCFDLIGELDTTGCLALSTLNDEGVLSGCEGDMVSAVGMLWARLATGTLPWMANPARIDTASGRVVLAHCTVPRSLVEAVRLDTHFESGRGIGLAGQFATGPVTLLRIGGAGLDRLWLTEGEIVAAGDDPSLCRTQIDVELPVPQAVELLERPLGNHVVVVGGHHADRLRRWHKALVATDR